MGVGITYTGTKRALAPAVAEVACHAQPGILFDAFAGMCSVGEAIGEARQIWTNDVQVFAYEVARAIFTSRDDPPSPLTYGDIHFDQFRKTQLLLSRIFSKSLAIENKLLQTTSFSAFQSKLSVLLKALSKETANCHSRAPHLFATTYSGSYFGIAQAIEADAIYAALNSPRRGRAISADEQRWGTVAIGRSLLKIANSIGHFAQHLRRTYRRYPRASSARTLSFCSRMHVANWELATGVAGYIKAQEKLRSPPEYWYIDDDLPDPCGSCLRRLVPRPRRTVAARCHYDARQPATSSHRAEMRQKSHFFGGSGRIIETRSWYSTYASPW
jgi:hypothetical protein